jgi:sugar O-acyltransferase (sialic acid O-acetyltransferase NeuD family)
VTDGAQPLVVVGGGGMGRCVLDVVDEVNRSSLSAHGHAAWEVVGVLDDSTPDLDLLTDRDVRHLGPVSRLSELPADVAYLVGIAAGAVRRRIDELGQSLGRPSPTLVHPNVHRGFGVELGPGSVVCSHVSMENNIRLGRHVHVNQNSTIGHDSRIASYATISPLVAVSGAVSLAEGAFLGTGSSVNQGLTVGGWSVVGSGAAVIRDVPDAATVVGVPARVVTR